MKILVKTIVIMQIVLVAVFAHAQENSWEELDAQAAELYQQGKYSEAIKVTEQALKVAKETFGPDHPNVATSLNNLAFLYYSQGQYAEAGPLYQRALVIREKTLGPNHPKVATVLENMVALYEKMGKPGEAKRLQARVESIRSEKQSGEPKEITP